MWSSLLNFVLLSVEGFSFRKYNSSCSAKSKPFFMLFRVKCLTSLFPSVMIFSATRYQNQMSYGEFPQFSNRIRTKPCCGNAMLYGGYLYLKINMYTYFLINFGIMSLYYEVMNFFVMKFFLFFSISSLENACRIMEHSKISSCVPACPSALWRAELCFRSVNEVTRRVQSHQRGLFVA